MYLKEKQTTVQKYPMCLSNLVLALKFLLTSVKFEVRNNLTDISNAPVILKIHINIANK